MRVILVDDEYWNLIQLESECKNISDIQIVGKFDDALDALEFAKTNELDMAFLDIEMPSMNGLDLAAKLRQLHPDASIIFVSAYEKYIADASKLQTHFFVTKPYTTEDIVSIIQEAKAYTEQNNRRIRIQTFGEFGIYIKEQKVVFFDKKAEEYLALLVDRAGEIVSAEEAVQLLWGGLPGDSWAHAFRKMIDNLTKTLKDVGGEDVIVESSKGRSVNVNRFECDYYDFLSGSPVAMNLWQGYYMQGFPWAQSTSEKIIRRWRLFTMNSVNATEKVPAACIRYKLDDMMTITYMNDSFLSLTGFTRDEIRDTFHDHLKEMIPEEDYHAFLPSDKGLGRSEQMREIEYRIRRKGGVPLWVADRRELFKEDELEAVILDNSKQKQLQMNASEKTQIDTMTGLINRATLVGIVEGFIASATLGTRGAMLIVNVDDFKKVNEVYGEPFGDRVIMGIASSLKKIFRSSDAIGRICGDEIVVFMKNIPGKQLAYDKAEEVLGAIIQKSQSRERGKEITCSLGISMFPEDGATFEELYNRASAALNQSRQLGKGRVAAFSQDGNSQAPEEFISTDNKNGEERKEDSDEAVLKNHFLNYTFRQLRDTDEFIETANTLLSIVGERLELSRIYILEYTRDGSSLYNTMNWLSSELSKDQKKIPNITFEKMKQYMRQMNMRHGMAICDDIDDLPEELREIMEQNSVASTIICELSDQYGSFGVIGFEECEKKRHWNGHYISLLKEFSKTIGIFLRLYQLQKRCFCEETQR